MGLLRQRPERTAHWYGVERALAWFGAALGGFGCVPLFTRISDWSVFENGTAEGALKLGLWTLIAAMVLDGTRWVVTRKSDVRFRFPLSALVGGFLMGIAVVGGAILAVLNFFGSLFA